MKIWDLYSEAKQEVTSSEALDKLINEAYILKLERRIDELEGGTSTIDERCRQLLEVLNADTRTMDEKLLKIKIVRAAFGWGLAEAKRHVESTEPLPF